MLTFFFILKFPPNKNTTQSKFQGHAFESCFWQSRDYEWWIAKNLDSRSSRVFRSKKIGEFHLCRRSLQFNSRSTCSTCFSCHTALSVPGPLTPSKLAPRQLAPLTTRPMDNSPQGQLALGTTRPRDNSPHGQLAPWTMDNSPHDNSLHGQLAPRTTRPMDNSPHDNSPQYLWQKIEGVVLYYFINTFHGFTLHYCFRWNSFKMQENLSHKENNSIHWFTSHHCYTYLHTHLEKLGSLFQIDLISF
jgi:hypothetical protein